MSDEPAAAPARDGFVDRLGDAVATVSLTLAGLALFTIVMINGVNVVARYFFGSPFSWAEELMLYLMIFGVFTGGIAITWRNQHIRIATIIEQAPPQFQFLARLVAAIASIAVLTTVTVASSGLVSLLHSFDQRSDALQAPMWIPQSFVTVGLSLMALLMTVNLVTSRLR
jgi:TRAP-type C4-dicarboxylate transport system permease small subunit